MAFTFSCVQPEGSPSTTIDARTIVWELEYHCWSCQQKRKNTLVANIRSKTKMCFWCRVSQLITNDGAAVSSLLPSIIYYCYWWYSLYRRQTVEGQSGLNCSSTKGTSLPCCVQHSSDFTALCPRCPWLSCWARSSRSIFFLLSVSVNMNTTVCSFYMNRTSDTGGSVQWHLIRGFLLQRRFRKKWTSVPVALFCCTLDGIERRMEQI